MDKRRSSDKSEPFKIILSIISPLLIAVIGFYMTSIKSDIKDLRMELKETNNNVIEIYNECKDEINSVRLDTQREITNKYDHLKVWILTKLNGIKEKQSSIQ